MQWGTSVGLPVGLLDPSHSDEAQSSRYSPNVHRRNGWIIPRALLDRCSRMLVRGRNHARSCRFLRSSYLPSKAFTPYSKPGSWVTGLPNTRSSHDGRSILSGESCSSHSLSPILKSPVRYLLGYSGLLMFATGVSAIATSVYLFGGLRASRAIHRQLISSVLGTTLRWLDSTPVARVIARCTQDMQSGVLSPLIDRKSVV